MARRLVEVGVRAVEVTLGGFDSHLDNFPIHAERASILDAGLSALLDDLVARDLLDRTIVLCLGEFGRTPQINALEGRDHWPHGFACLLGGGGLRSGQIIGETDPEGAAPPKEPVPVEDLAATILTAAGLDPTAVLHTPVGRPLSLSRGHALARLIG